MEARIDRRFRNDPAPALLARASDRSQGSAPVAAEGAKVLLLSHVFLILLFALAAWTPLLVAQELLN